jgi:capsular exopolysaccharide synthesis family protein
MIDRIKQYAGGGDGSGARTNGDALDPRALWLALWRQKWVIAGITGSFTVAAVLISLLLTPLYKSEVLIRVQASEAVAVDVPEFASDFELDDSTIESEIESITSNAFLGRVIDRLELIADPEFNPIIEDLAPGTDVKELFTDQTPDDGRRKARLETLRTFKKAVSVTQSGRSHVIAITVISERPAKAARIANAIGDEYLRAQWEAKFDASEKAARWLSERVDEFRGKVVELERQLVLQQTGQGIFNSSTVDPLALQVIDLNSRLADAQASRAEVEARYRQVETLLNSRNGLGAASEVLSSPLLGELRIGEAALGRQLAELSTIYGDRHPQIVDTRAELGAQRARIRAEVQRMVSDLENEVSVARAREQELRAQLDQLKAGIVDQERGTVSARELEREAITARATYERYLDRLSAITEVQELQQADAVILSEGVVPLEPAFPKKTMIVILAFAAGFVISISVAFLIERFTAEVTFRNSDEVREHTGFDTLTSIPLLDDTTLKDEPPEAYILDNPVSPFSEAVQRLRTNLYLFSSEPCRTLLFTSTLPGEGKTTIAVALARQSARAGIRTLLIDADMRRPRCHQALGVANGPGLSDILQGRPPKDDAIHVDPPTGLHFMRAGMAHQSPADLCRSKTMKKFLQQIAAIYDLVVIDSPPVGAVSDSVVLSNLVDRTAYITAWDSSPREAVVGGLKQLEDADAHVAGVVLSMVNVKRQAQYGYNDFTAYQSYYGERGAG